MNEWDGDGPHHPWAAYQGLLRDCCGGCGFWIRLYGLRQAPGIHQPHTQVVHIAAAAHCIIDAVALNVGAYAEASVSAKAQMRATRPSEVVKMFIVVSRGWVDGLATARKVAGWMEVFRLRVNTSVR